MMRKMLINIGTRSKEAFAQKINTNKKNKVLSDYLNLIKKNKFLILKANKKDINRAIKIKLKDNLINRLTLDEKKILGIINSIKKIIKLKDPIDNVLEKWKRPNGLIFLKVSIPIGVIGVIYESRPNVTSDVASLCFKSGNPVILRGGSEAFYSNKILSTLFFLSAFLNSLAKALFEFMASEPPFKITTFPDLKQRLATSEVTFGLLS